MVAELHPGFARGFTGLVELVGITAKLDERSALGGHQVGDHHILHPGLARLIDGLLPCHPGGRALRELSLPGTEVSRDQRRRKVPADRLNAELLAERQHDAVRILQNLSLVITDRGETLEGFTRMIGNEVADGVDLKAERTPRGRRDCRRNGQARQE